MKEINEGMYGLDPQKTFEEVINGTRVMIGNERFKAELVIHRELILKRGIRAPEQILDDLRTEKMDDTVRKRFNGKGPENKKDMEDLDFYDDKSSLYPEKPSINL